MKQETCKELREKIAEVIDNTLPWTREDCLDFADRIIKVIPQPEVMSEEEMLVLMINKIPSKYYNNPNKIKEFGDVFEEIVHALAGKGENEKDY